MRDLTGVTIPVWTEHFANDQNTLQVEERGGAVPPPPPGPLVTSKTNIRNVMDFSSNPNVKQIKVVEKFVFKNTTKMHNKSNSTTRNRENY